ncbi:MAG: hypothetical protein QM756_36355 [Polyangiaceae bacterium]
MGSERLLFISGTLLLAVSALLGFVQHRHRKRPHAFALWRVVHAGGTAGAIQLLALAAVWQRFAPGQGAALLALGLVVATVAFFLGPLARALKQPRIANALLALGAAVAMPTYVALPLALFL